jgi:hypothetical protein
MLLFADVQPAFAAQLNGTFAGPTFVALLLWDAAQPDD